MHADPGNHRQPISRRSPRPAALLALGLLLAALAGCSEEGALKLARWRVSGASLPSQEVTLPVHLPTTNPAGARPAHYVLTRTLDLDPEWRGLALTLSVVKLPALSRLRVNGQEVRPRERLRQGSYRVAGTQTWDLSPDLSRGGRLELELTLPNTWVQAGWLDAVPRLSRDPDGAAHVRYVGTWNYVTSVLGLAATVISALLMLAIFLFNRQRKDTAWFALEAFGGALYPAVNVDLLQPLVGRLEPTVGGLGVAIAGLAGVYMMHAMLGLGRPHWAWRAAWLVYAVVAVVVRGPFVISMVAAGGGLFLAAAAVYQVVGYARAARRGNSPGAFTLSVGWVALIALGGVDILSWLGLGQLFGGFQGAGIGIFMIALAQSINLAREHIRALATADTLNQELQARLAALEERNKEVQQLNQELRHQVGVRSHELAEALARSPGMGEGTKSIAVGDVINERYRIESVIGSGGMGVVYQATRLTDERRCALKLIKHRPSTEHLARLSREAMVLAEIEHPNIISIYDINVSRSGQLYIVMELAEGESLDRKHDRFGDLAWGLPIMSQTAQALATIHARNVIHRDLKPANILVLDPGYVSPAGVYAGTVPGTGGAQGPRAGPGAGAVGSASAVAQAAPGIPHIKVLDFGLAGLLATDSSSVMQLVSTVEAMSPAPGFQTPSLTQTGAILGTPLYMAPEFVSGTKEIGPPADIFSYGVIAYEVLGRERPFTELPLAMAVKGRDLAPKTPLLELSPALDPQVAELLTRCLLADPAERPTAQELAEALG